MKNSVSSVFGKRFLKTIILGLGVVMLSISSVAEANIAAAAAKAIIKSGKIVSKAKPIKVPTQAAGTATRYIPARTAVEIERHEGTAARLIEHQRREQEKSKSQNSGWFNW